MAYLREDKENFCASEPWQNRSDEFSKLAGESIEKADPKRRFSRLLTDATNTVRHDLDHKVAIKSQEDDCSSIINEWISEQRDSRLAARVAQEIEEEFKNLRMTELSKGEAAAMKLALDERKAMQQNIQNRREIEEKDAAMAKRTYDEEVEIVNNCGADDKYARTLNDEEYAVREAEREVVLNKKRLEEDSAADAKFAIQHQKEMYRLEGLAAKQEDDDYKIASRLNSEEEERYNSKVSKKDMQEKNDLKMTRKLEIADMRAEHRRRKYVELMRERTGRTVQDLWREVDPIAEDVMGGICVTLLLPNIKNLSVKLSRKRTVTVEATRLPLESETVPLTPDDSIFDTDFEIEGKPDSLIQSDISYDYSSENGILHVYIENVHLGVIGANEKEDTKIVPKSLSLNGIKNKFTKIFSGLKN